MRHFLTSLYLLGTFLHTLTKCTMSATDFHLDGDHLIGGLFNIHYAHGGIYQTKPQAIDCSSQPFSLSDYRRFQMMRFAVEQINNSTYILPNVSLGYEIFDHCSDTKNFPGILNLISVNGLIQPWFEPLKNFSRVMAVVGPFTSTDALTIAPLFMTDLIPMVSYGVGSSRLSNKIKFPSFLRTVHSNDGMIEVIVKIIVHFNWRWVAFLNSDNDYGRDGLDLFIKKIDGTDICLAYTNALNDNTNYSQIFEQIEAQKIHVVIVFAPEATSEALVETAVQVNFRNKVWIACDTWSINKRLSKMKGIRNIGTVLGVSQPVETVPGFNNFIYSTKRQTFFKNEAQTGFCNQACNCSYVTPEDIISADASYSFTVYSAVYAIAHGLHNALQCGDGKCSDKITLFPYMVLEELQKSNFTLLNQNIQFDENGDFKSGSYSVVFWNQTGDAQEIGFYSFYPSLQFFINNTMIKWYTDGDVPTSLCSAECPVGYVQKQTGIHKCCFNCEICPNGTYINITEDRYNCINCKDTQWSKKGSISCDLRVVEYMPFTDNWAILIMVGAWALVGMTLSMSVLFVVNYNTPVVKSAGGPMCFLILGCLSLSSLSVFFYFGKPTVAFCVLRYLPFLLFYTICLACFVVRSFQIVCIFKIAAQIPKLHSWWMKYHGQHLVITVAFITEAFLLLISYSYAAPKPYQNKVWYPDKILLDCEINPKAISCSVILPLLLCSLCFAFSYMGKDLPKNYNEAKAITFCLLLLILTWIVFVTQYMLYRGKFILMFNALAVLSSLYCFLLWYFLPKCYIIIFQPHRNTPKYFQSLIQNYTKTISQ
ncbi:taste receptor type 1 member 2-like [Maylandia zebra]|uniref:Taste receptor type 1 member 2-like n=1 Tax=Maylandia zebra TaxID=106582 RepID=A0A3P9CYZ8_9CICH|nr:taste receptor type 1 member 2-like [Maylandia zebra]